MKTKAGNSCYYSVQTLLSSRILSKNLKIEIYKTIILQAMDIWKQDPRAQEECEWGMKKALHWGTS